MAFTNSAPIGDGSPDGRLPEGVLQAIRLRYPVDALETRTAGVLTIGSQGDFPTDYVQEGIYLGIHGEVRRRVAEILGLELQIESMLWPAMLPAVEAGDIDLPGVGTGWTPERARRFQFTQPFQYFYFGIASREGKTTWEIADLRGQCVGAIDTSFNNDELVTYLGGESVRLQPSLDAVVNDLLEGATDVAIYDFPNISTELTKRRVDNDYLVGRFAFDMEHPLTTGRFPCYLVYKSDAYHLRAASDLALDAIKMSGELEEIHRRYGFTRDDFRMIAS